MKALVHIPFDEFNRMTEKECSVSGVLAEIEIPEKNQGFVRSQAEMKSGKLARTARRILNGKKVSFSQAKVIERHGSTSIYEALENGNYKEL